MSRDLCGVSWLFSVGRLSVQDCMQSPTFEGYAMNTSLSKPMTSVRDLSDALLQPGRYVDTSSSEPSSCRMVSYPRITEKSRKPASTRLRRRNQANHRLAACRNTTWLRAASAIARAAGVQVLLHSRFCRGLPRLPQRSRFPRMASVDNDQSRDKSWSTEASVYGNMALGCQRSGHCCCHAATQS